MALTGTLSEVPILDLLQMLCHNRQPGQLIVTTSDGEHSIFFLGGQIFHFISPIKRDPLGHALIKMGLLTEEQRVELLDDFRNRSEQTTPLGAFLVRRGVVEKRHIRTIVADQLAELVYQLDLHGKGSFRYQQGTEHLPSHEISLGLTTGQVVLRGLTIVEGISELQEHIESFRQRIEHTESLATAENLTLEPDYWNVISLADGHRSLAEISRIANLSLLTTARITFELLQQGLIHILSLSPKQPSSTAIKRQQVSPEKLNRLLGEIEGGGDADDL